MKSCELCKLAATTYCKSDQASLCWDCDAKVHGANFLVARHVRCLLCHACQSLTPWRAAGSKLGHTVSVCERCVNDGGDNQEESGAENEDNGDGDDEEEESDSDEDLSVSDDVDREDGDNQVVPWSTNTPPPACSSSSNQDSSGGEREVSRSRSTKIFSLKRLRKENASDLCSQDQIDRLYPKRRYSAGHRTVLSTRCRQEEEAVPVCVDSTRLSSKEQHIKSEGTPEFESDSIGAESMESLGENLVELDKIQ